MNFNLLKAIGGDKTYLVSARDSSAAIEKAYFDNLFDDRCLDGEDPVKAKLSAVDAMHSSLKKSTCLMSLFEKKAFDFAGLKDNGYVFHLPLTGNVDDDKLLNPSLHDGLEVFYVTVSALPGMTDGDIKFIVSFFESVSIMPALYYADKYDSIPNIVENIIFRGQCVIDEVVKMAGSEDIEKCKVALAKHGLTGIDEFSKEFFVEDNPYNKAISAQILAHVFKVNVNTLSHGYASGPKAFR